ncbi:MAG TPA: glucose-1-phosphate adenylyltransferase subunit GlgD, partial [Erysipelotrichaceae bacterium]|nr:glucose-1-phosphate adenylyltransferase subunit GlgD [Erysipelotrichaceae bacterium]
KVEADAVLENVIVDKDARIKKIKELKGSADEPLYVKEGDVV